ncbi:MAG: endonuclease domain-containing protein [Ignavibacteria bacterium]|nr:endonuclease domain-containing protein [Ignavibacteria bacterium]
MGQIFNKKVQKETRQLLRNTATGAERLLWSRLKHSQLLGYKFRRQQGVGGYIVDFYCPEAKLAIEIDGATHSTTDEIAYDARRQGELEALGLTVLRFWNTDVYKNLNGVLDAIAQKLNERDSITH